ncbi:MAG: hypothetical protein V2A79_08970 [Planctomycetota bacterium]
MSFALLLPLLHMVVVMPVHGMLEQRRATTTKQTIETLVTSITAIRSRTGRMPMTEAELVGMLGTAMPLSAWGDPIHYRVWEGQIFRYQIRCVTQGLAGTVYQFDSAAPTAGVTQGPF